MKTGGDLGNLRDAERDAFMLQHLLEFGITPQMWHPHYKSVFDRLTPEHIRDITRLKYWRLEAENAQRRK